MKTYTAGQTLPPDFSFFKLNFYTVKKQTMISEQILTKNSFSINLVIDYNTKTFSIRSTKGWKDSFIFLETKNDTRELLYLIAEAQTIAFEKLEKYQKELKSKPIDFEATYKVKLESIEISTLRKASKWAGGLYITKIDPKNKLIWFESPNKLSTTVNKLENQLDFILKKLKEKNIKFKTILENTSTGYTAQIVCGFSEEEFENILDKIRQSL